jgi:acetyl/propionyl-CoA carboxylase alpha subunit
VGYDNVGTWEWIVTPRGAPFLMEVNTRIQVENGVSGRVASIRGDGPVDLIREQIRMGLGEDMGYSQEDISLDGVSIEYRIIAEEPDNRFSPSSGTITRFEWPDEPWLTVSTQVPADTSYQIPTEFDPNLALAIVWGENLEQAKDRGRRFLESLVLEGVEPGGRPLHTNINFLLHKNERLLEF